MREWEEETTAKKQANEENRALLDDRRHRRPSTPPRDAYRRSSVEARRAEDQRRSDEPKKEEPRSQSDNYHPSEAAHHPQSHSVGGSNQLPPMQSASGPSSEKSQTGLKLKEERPLSEQTAVAASAPVVSEPERAARQMDVDEDYDDSPEDEKKPAAVPNGSAPTSGSGDVKTTSPTNAGINGSTSIATKAE